MKKRNWQIIFLLCLLALLSLACINLGAVLDDTFNGIIKQLPALPAYWI